MRRPRVVIAEDHELVAQSLAAILKPTYEVAALVPDGADVVETVRRLRPDLLLLDLTLPRRTGLDLLPDVVKACPDLKVLVVTMHTHRVYLNMALQMGAHGFIPKNASLKELRGAIADVLAGRPYVSPMISRRSRKGMAANAMGFSQLTERQKEIVRLVGKGLSTREIAKKTGLTHFTVHYHRKSIRKELGLKNDFELRRYGLTVLMSEAGDAADVVDTAAADRSRGSGPSRTRGHVSGKRRASKSLLKGRPRTR